MRYAAAFVLLTIIPSFSAFAQKASLSSRESIIRDSLALLDSLFTKTQDTTAKINLLQQSAALLVQEEKIMANPLQLKSAFTNLYLNLSNLYLCDKKFGQAEDAAWLGLSKDKTSNPLFGALAHSYLLQNKWSQAEGLYLRLKDANCKQSKTGLCKDTLLADFIQFEKLGITHPDFAKARVALR